MNLTMMQCHPSAEDLAAWATRTGIISPDGDYGYAFHALLTAAFGSAAPKPFRYLGQSGGLLGYTQADADTLMSHAALATPDVYRALNLSTLAARRFPTSWMPGQALSFEVRVRPVIRGKNGERDAFLHAVTNLSAEASQRIPREEVYRQWLVAQLEANGACSVQLARMKGFQFMRVVRRARPEHENQRSHQIFNGPDALMSGILKVSDGEAFSRQLARGVGRHRAFGFGMLLLRPAS